jgi:hypothetical protein
MAEVNLWERRISQPYAAQFVVMLLVTGALAAASAAAETPAEAPKAVGVVAARSLAASHECAVSKAFAIRLLAAQKHKDRVMSALSSWLWACGGADSDLWLAFGSELHEKGERDGALRCWRAAWRLNPLSVALANNVAAALIDLSRPLEAIAALRALEHRLSLIQKRSQPALPRGDTWEDRRGAERGAGRVGEWTGDESWKTHINMASALAETERLWASAERLERALTHPALTKTHPQWPVAAANLLYTRRRLCEWANFDADMRMAAEMIRQQIEGMFDFVLPSALPVDPFMALTFLCGGVHGGVEGGACDAGLGVGAEQVLAATVKYAASWHVPHNQQLQFAGTSSFSLEDRGVGVGRVGRVRVGYVCSEFGRRHSVMLLMRAVFMRHDRSSFQVVCFSTEKVEEGEGSGNGVPEGCVEAHELGADGDKGRAQMINGREIHVVVDLNGWTGGHVMGALAFKPAPLIINYMGFAGSTGARFVDYAAFDPVVAPPEHTSHFSESLLLLPLSYFVTDFMRSDFSAPQDAGAQEKVRAEEEMAQVGKAEGLMPAAVRVCNHDQAYKLDPSRFRWWCRIARSTRTTQLWLLRQDARVEARVRAAAPPDLRTRLVFAAKVGVRAHIRRIRLCQLALDTASIGAHTTAANYLWARVPVVTVPGMHVMSRVAASLLVALARDSREQNRNRTCSPVTLARSESEYVGIARALVKAAAAGALASGRGVADKDTPQLPPQALTHTYTRVLECLRAATEPLDARGSASSSAASSAPSRDMIRAPAVFNTARWVRDWERALMTVLDLSLSCQEYWGHWSRGEGRRSHGNRLSLPHVIVS